MANSNLWENLPPKFKTPLKAKFIPPIKCDGSPKGLNELQ
jgi:hypothetical protein